MRDGLLVAGWKFLHHPPVRESPFMTHANAPLTPTGPLRMVHRHLHDGVPQAHVAAKFRVSRLAYTEALEDEKAATTVGFFSRLFGSNRKVGWLYLPSRTPWKDIMSIVITGATGQLGRQVVETLLERNVPPQEIVAAGRAVDKIADLAQRGVHVRKLDYTDAASVGKALKGASKVLLISGSEVGQRVEQHRTVIEAAQREGIQLVAYTSIANADGSGMKLAVEHQATETLLEQSGVPFVLLRNSWYLENYTDQLPGVLAQGALVGSAGNGRVSAASRADYAQAAAAVLLADDQAGRIYELGGDEPFTMAELAAEISAAAGQHISYQDLPPREYAAMLVRVGVPEGGAEILADSDLGIARGDLLVNSGDLSRLIGRPATSMAEAVRSAVAAI